VYGLTVAAINGPGAAAAAAGAVGGGDAGAKTELSTVGSTAACGLRSSRRRGGASINSCTTEGSGRPAAAITAAATALEAASAAAAFLSSCSCASRACRARSLSTKLRPAFVWKYGTKALIRMAARSSSTGTGAFRYQSMVRGVGDTVARGGGGGDSRASTLAGVSRE
jgi:hypothetical protein